MKLLNGKKCKVFLVLHDTNTSNDILTIKNPKGIIIPTVGETIDLDIFDIFDINDTSFSGNGDFTVKSVRKNYTISKKNIVYSIFVELI